MKGLLPILVVVLHTSSSSVQLDCWQSTENFLRVVLYKFGECAVPAFFLISGFLLFNGMDSWRAWACKLKKRLRTLLVPYVLWIVAFFFILYVMDIAKGTAVLGWDAIKERFVNAGGIKMFYDRPAMEMPLDVPLWYVRDLMILMVLSPVFYALLKYTGFCGIAVLAALYLTDTGIPFAGFSTTGFFFFPCGALFAMKELDFCNVFEKIGRWSYLAAALLLATSLTISGKNYGWLPDIVEKLFIISMVLAVFNFAIKYVDSGHQPVNLLTDSSFFIYAIHNAFIAEIANFLLWRALPITAEWMLVLKVFLRPALTVGICLLLYVAMKRFSPRTLALLTGGRG